MFNQKNAAQLAEEFFAAQQKLKAGFIQKINDVIEAQRFKIAGYVEAKKVIEENQTQAELEVKAAESILKEIK